MTLAEYKKRLDIVGNLLKNQRFIINEVMVAAGRVMWGEFVRRVFVLGQDASGGAIGAYSKKPAYFSPNQRGIAGVPKPRIALPKTFQGKGRKPALKLEGKNGDTVFKNGKPHKTAYLANGYFQFRKAYGRQNNFVDLNLTGTLLSSVQLATTSNGILLFFAAKKQAEIARGNEAKFGKDIFSISTIEANVFRDEMRRILTLLVNRIMNGETKI